MRAQPQASHYIDGAYVEDTKGDVIESIYPATGEVIARVHAATPDIIERAIKAAHSAQQAWGETAGVERGRILRRAADMIRERNRELSELETLDTGKPITETMEADPTSAADSLEYYGGLAASLGGEHIDLGSSANGSFVYTRREPIGVCAGIGAWNYPIQVAAWKAAPALVCGNAAIFKPSETTPLTALKLAEILIEAGLPAGLYNVIQGAGPVGSALSSHHGIDKISVTGSVPTGMKVMEGASKTLKNVTLELGGKSPLIVFKDADLTNAVSGAMLGNFYSTGQVCSNGTRVFVHKPVLEDFLSALAPRCEAMKLGDPMDESTHMGPLVSKAQYERVLGYMKAGVEDGARLVTGGGAADVPDFPDGLFVQPTVFANVSDNMRIAREEIFGPVMSVFTFDDEDEVIARANDTEFGLSAAVFTQNLARAHRVIGKFKAGSCWINTYNLTPVEAPFGGMKRSGIGRENGKIAIEHYSELKTVYVEMGDVASAY